MSRIVFSTKKLEMSAHSPRPRSKRPIDATSVPKGDKIEDFEYKELLLELLEDSRLSLERTEILLNGAESPFDSIVAIASVCEKKKTVTLRMLRILIKVHT
jgi:hypothetical protein